MTGTLYVVATPIGNLEDVTLRALRILREVSVIAAEDTRRTARLLQHYSISTRTTSLHEHNERQKTPALLDRLKAGQSIALVSDAGTPVISDPGQTFVAAARAEGIRVESIPGPSAVMAAIAASGLPTAEFVFLGFPPTRSTDRDVWLRRLAGESRLVVFFEAPHRIIGTLKAIGAMMGMQKRIGVGRELTKVHEELVIEPISVLMTLFASPRGEFTVLVPPEQPLDSAIEMPLPLAALRTELGFMTNEKGRSKRQAVRMLAERHGIAPNELYKLLTELPSSGK
jgi:16S rRNA (cytidine1402-2'-O)-methyltransferase